MFVQDAVILAEEGSKTIYDYGAFLPIIVVGAVVIIALFAYNHIKKRDE